jgi:uncharacterized protein (DUF58 family)
MRSAEQLSEAYLTATQVVERLQLPLGAQAWKGQAGEFRGAGVGSSIDFQDHRDYSPGDDPRHINWQAFARTGQYSMKLYREEVRPVIDLIVDVSNSMWVESEKAQRTAELLYFFTLSAQKSGASLRVAFINGDATVPVSLEAILTHRWVDEIASLQSSDLALPPQLGQLRSRANAIRIFLSDLLFEGDPAPLLRGLHDRQGTGLVFAPFTKAEANPAWNGQYDFIDAEEQTRHPHQIGAAVLERYLEAYERHFSLWKEACRKHQIALCRVVAAEDLYVALNQEAVRQRALEVAP